MLEFSPSDTFSPSSFVGLHLIDQSALKHSVEYCYLCFFKAEGCAAVVK